MHDTDGSTTGDRMAPAMRKEGTVLDLSTLREIAALTTRLVADVKDIDARVSVLEKCAPGPGRRHPTPDAPVAP